MRKFILLSVLSLALAACTTVDGHRKFDARKACEIAIMTAGTTQDIAHVALRYGLKPEKALAIATAAKTGEMAIDAVCTVLVP